MIMQPEHWRTLLKGLALAFSLHGLASVFFVLAMAAPGPLDAVFDRCCLACLGAAAAPIGFTAHDMLRLPLIRR